MTMSDRDRFDYDWLVIGSGFGGSVAALRLAEKGYRVGVLECGRRYADEDFAKTSWQMHSDCSSTPKKKRRATESHLKTLSVPRWLIRRRGNHCLICKRLFHNCP